MMKTVDASPEKLSQVMAAIPKDRPIVMLNMLKFRERALYPDGTSDCSGREAYRRYSQVAAKMVAQVGGNSGGWMGAVQGTLIGPGNESWDSILLVEYPSIQAFKRMLATPEYQACTVHRMAALEDSRLICTMKSDRAA